MTEPNPIRITDSKLAERLRKHGLRLTPQRLAVYQALVANDQHPTAAILYKQLSEQIPSLSQATVYNTLQVLVEKGLVHEIGDAGDGHMHYDADISPHLNLVCRRCRRIFDFHDPRLADLDALITAGSGFDLQGARLVYYGVCPECRLTDR